MNLSDILIVGSIITGLLSIPFLVVGPFNDYIPTGKILLGLNNSDVTKIPSRTTKILNFERFERTYETAFGKFHFIMSADNIIQELSRPGMNVKVIDRPNENIWHLSTHNYTLKITQNSDQTIEEFSSADGSLTRVKENGGVNETFEGFNPEILEANLEEAKTTLESEVERMEQIKLETVLPELGFSSSGNLKAINITNINATAEWVEITNIGSNIVDMSGWTLSDASNNVFTFSDGFKLNPSSSVKVYSGSAYLSCNPSQATLCWKSSNIWNDAGDTATLKDSIGTVISVYSY